MRKKLTIYGTTEFGQSKYSAGESSPTYIGGNGILASLAASKHADVNLISVVGTDLNKNLLSDLLGPNINIDNVLQFEGKTFSYQGVYDPKTFELQEEIIEFGVYKDHIPVVNPKLAENTKAILFSGSNPRFGVKVFEQLKNPKVVGVNTLLYHLKHNTEFALQLLKNADYLFTNKQEFQFLTEKLGKNLFSQLPKLKYIFNTLGTEGVRVITKDQTHHFPPSRSVDPKDPTNAGDVFTGTIMGFIADGVDLKQSLEKVIKNAQEESIKVLINDPFYRKKFQNEAN